MSDTKACRLVGAPTTNLHRISREEDPMCLNHVHDLNLRLAVSSSPILYAATSSQATRSRANPIAPSPTVHSPAQEAANCTPDPRLLTLSAAIANVAPPIEDGERCHVCNAPAVTLAKRVAWCKDCVSAMFLAHSLKMQNGYPRRELEDHALELAHPWHKLFCRMHAEGWLRAGRQTD